MVQRVLVGLLAALVATLVVGWLAFVHPIFEAVTNVRAQLFPIATLVLIGFIVLRSWRLVVGSALVLAICLSYVVPYWTATADPLPLNAETTRVMQYNIYFGNDDARAIADHVDVADADVVVLHEVTPNQWANLEPLLLNHPHHIAEPLDESRGQLGGGLVMVSRHPIQRVAVSASISPGDRVVVAGTTELNGTPTLVIGLHPFASRTDSRKANLRQRQLNGVAELASNSALPVVIVADLNIAPTSPQYHGFINDLGWRDPHRIVGWKSTWPTWGPGGLPIDHVFVSNDFALHSYELGDGAGSDHRSLVAEISLAADATS